MSSVPFNAAEIKVGVGAVLKEAAALGHAVESKIGSAFTHTSSAAAHAVGTASQGAAKVLETAVGAAAGGTHHVIAQTAKTAGLVSASQGAASVAKTGGLRHALDSITSHISTGYHASTHGLSVAAGAVGHAIANPAATATLAKAAIVNGAGHAVTAGTTLALAHPASAAVAIATAGGVGIYSGGKAIARKIGSVMAKEGNFAERALLSKAGKGVVFGI